jgi:hypothetical protein
MIQNLPLFEDGYRNTSFLYVFAAGIYRYLELWRTWGGGWPLVEVLPQPQLTRLHAGPWGHRQVQRIVLHTKHIGLRDTDRSSG